MTSTVVRDELRGMDVKCGKKRQDCGSGGKTLRKWLWRNSFIVMWLRQFS